MQNLDDTQDLLLNFKLGRKTKYDIDFITPDSRDVSMEAVGPIK